MCPEGTAQVSIDMTNQTGFGPAPSNGFSQNEGPASVPPVPAAVEAAATQFQQTFGRRLTFKAVHGHLEEPSALRERSEEDELAIRQADRRREIAAHEAKLRETLAKEQHL